MNQGRQSSFNRHRRARGSEREGVFRIRDIGEL